MDILACCSHTTKQKIPSRFIFLEIRRHLVRHSCVANIKTTIEVHDKTPETTASNNNNNKINNNNNTNNNTINNETVPHATVTCNAVLPVYFMSTQNQVLLNFTRHIFTGEYHDYMLKTQTNFTVTFFSQDISSRDSLPVVMTSSTTGYVTSPGFDAGFDVPLPYVGAVNVTIPPDCSLMISFPLSNFRERLDITILQQKGHPEAVNNLERASVV
jgi:hypothetical protein